MYEEIYDKIKGWCLDYLPPADAEELAGALTDVTKRYGHANMIAGMILGSIGSALLIAYFS